MNDIYDGFTPGEAEFLKGCSDPAKMAPIFRWMNTLSTDEMDAMLRILPDVKSAAELMCMTYREAARANEEREDNYEHAKTAE